MQSNHAATLRSCLAATAAAGPHWSADGRALAFVWNEPGSYHVYVADRPFDPTQSFTQVTSGPDRCTDPRFLPGGDLLYTSDAGGNENFQIFAASRTAAGWSTRRLTSDDAAKHRVLSVSEGEVLFVANDRDRARFTLYAQQLPVSVWEPRAVFTPDRGVIQQTTRCADGAMVAQVTYGNMSQEILLIDETPRSLTAALSGDREVRWSLIRDADNGTLLVATDLDADRLRPVLLSLDGTVTPLDAMVAPTGPELGESAYRPGDRATWLELNEDGYSRLYRLDGLSPNARLTAVELPLDGTIVAGDARTSRLGVALAPSGDAIAIAASGPAEVANVWIARLETGATPAWRRLTSATVPDVPPEQLAGCSLSRFASFDGESVPYFTYLPNGDRGDQTQLPAVLLIHGGPEAQSRPAFNNVVQFLAAAGFAVVVPNIRGSAGYGRRYLDLDNREKRLDATRDIAELARHLTATHPEIDGGRLAVAGGSYGGFAVLSSLTEYPELWKAGVDIVGISNFVTFLQNTAAWRRGLRESEYGSLEDRELLDRISPINRIDRITAPLLIIQGDNDERVPLSESVQMYERLRDLGRTVELMRFADEGHGVTKLQNRITAYTRMVEWLQEHLSSRVK